MLLRRHQHCVENDLQRIAAHDDVVEPAGDVEAGFASHWASVVNGRNYAINYA